VLLAVALGTRKIMVMNDQTPVAPIVIGIRNLEAGAVAYNQKKLL